MNSTQQDIDAAANAKWSAFYQAATMEGVWFIAFAASLALVKWSDGAALAVTMCVISISMAVIAAMLMLAAMIEAHQAKRALTAARRPGAGQGSSAMPEVRK